MYHTNILEDMIKEGYSKKWAEYFLTGIQNENKLGVFDKKYADWAHSQGFFAAHAYSYGLNESNVDNYLSDYDYYKIWPLNSWSRIWINDKLTLKYMLSGTKYDHMMPKYYFYSSDNGLKALMDVDMNKYNSMKEAFLSTLKAEGEFAAKPNNGTESRGFVKLTYKNGKYAINSKSCDEEDVLNFVTDNTNYVFTEYLYPSKDFEKYSDQIHTLRIVTLNQSGYKPQIVAGFIRFPNNTSGEANYNVFETNVESKYNLYTYIDVSTGRFEQSIKTYVNHIESTHFHPDSKALLEGELPNYKEFVSEVKGICCLLSNLEYMGFDFGVTDSGYKIMEINSHPGINTSQVREPFFKNSVIGSYFKSKLNVIESLSDQDKEKRTHVVR